MNEGHLFWFQGPPDQEEVSLFKRETGFEEPDTLRQLILRFRLSIEEALSLTWGTYQRLSEELTTIKELETAQKKASKEKKKSEKTLAEFRAQREVLIHKIVSTAYYTNLFEPWFNQADTTQMLKYLFRGTTREPSEQELSLVQHFLKSCKYKLDKVQEQTHVY